jgi:hypothetical protein
MAQNFFQSRVERQYEKQELTAGVVQTHLPPLGSHLHSPGGSAALQNVPGAQPTIVQSKPVGLPHAAIPHRFPKQQAGSSLQPGRQLEPAKQISPPEQSTSALHLLGGTHTTQSFRRTFAQPVGQSKLGQPRHW